MTSSVPYLLRAIYDWLLDNQCTPYLIVDAMYEDTSVPTEYVKDNQIVLNISPVAVRDLQIESDFVQFSGRFAGVPHEIYAPIGSILGIVAKENNEGMWFPRPEIESVSAKDQELPDSKRKKGPPSLKIVE